MWSQNAYFCTHDFVDQITLAVIVVARCVDCSTLRKRTNERSLLWFVRTQDVGRNSSADTMLRRLHCRRSAVIHQERAVILAS